MAARGLAPVLDGETGGPLRMGITIETGGRLRMGITIRTTVKGQRHDIVRAGPQQSCMWWWQGPPGTWDAGYT